MVIKRKLIGCCVPSKANNYEDCFTDDLSPSEEKFVCRSFTSVTQRHLISIREDKEGDANPTLLVAELK